VSVGCRLSGVSTIDDCTSNGSIRRRIALQFLVEKAVDLRDNRVKMMLVLLFFEFASVHPRGSPPFVVLASGRPFLHKMYMYQLAWLVTCHVNGILTVDSNLTRTFPL
jgi:hypothetical protein